MLTPPPESSGGLRPEFLIRSAYYAHFEGFFNKLEDTYKSRFRWFTTQFSNSDHLAIIGPGSGGAEAFALMWHLSSRRAIAFENEFSRVQQSNRNRRAPVDLVNLLVPAVLNHSSGDYRREFDQWYRESVQREIRNLILPEFLVSDIEIGLASRSGYFDVCYSRYLLDKVVPARRASAFQEMARITKPGGHVIVVAPSSAFSFGIADSCVSLVKTVDEHELGNLEWPSNPPTGRLYLKRC